MNKPEQLSEFVTMLNRESPGASVEIDAPRDPNGEWWLDIVSGDAREHVSWRPKVGFGFFTTDERGFGDRPDEIYRKVDDACARLCRLIEQRRTNASTPMGLKDVRHMIGTPQTQLAAALKTNQAAVSRLEHRTDMYLSSLGEYIRAMGGQLELRAKFKDFEIRIDPLLVARK
jgi:hypothetical protein